MKTQRNGECRVIAARLACQAKQTAHKSSKSLASLTTHYFSAGRFYHIQVDHKRLPVVDFLVMELSDTSTEMVMTCAESRNRVCEPMMQNQNKRKPSFNVLYKHTYGPPWMITKGVNGDVGL